MLKVVVLALLFLSCSRFAVHPSLVLHLCSWCGWLSEVGGSTPQSLWEQRVGIFVEERMSLQDLKNLKNFSSFEAKKRVVEEFVAKNPHVTELDLRSLFLFFCLLFVPCSWHIFSLSRLWLWAWRSKSSHSVSVCSLFSSAVRSLWFVVYLSICPLWSLNNIHILCNSHSLCCR